MAMRFARQFRLGFVLSAVVGVAIVGCGAQIGAGSGSNGPATTPVLSAPYCVATVAGSPEEVALAAGHCSSRHAAPIEGSPEQTAADLGRS